MSISASGLSPMIPPSSPIASDEEVAAWERERREADVRRRIAGAGIPERYRMADASQCHPKVAEFADLCANGDALNLVIFGEAGSGKTHAACAALKAVVTKRPALALFASEPTVLCEMRDTWGSRDREDDVMCRYAAPWLFVLDDLGRSCPDRRALDMLWRLIDRRYSAKRPTIYTTQYDRATLAARLASGGGDEETVQAIIRRVMDDERAMSFRAVRR